MLSYLNTVLLRLYLAPLRFGRQSDNPPPADIFLARHGHALRMRSDGGSCKGRISSVFSLGRKRVTVTTFRRRCFRGGYEIKQYSGSFDEIRYLGLQFSFDGETAKPYWSIVLRFKDGGLLSLTFNSEDYLGCDAALTHICESTKIPRSD